MITLSYRRAPWPTEFTPESIVEAGQELQATGRNITGFALRQKVGGGGQPLPLEAGVG